MKLQSSNPASGRRDSKASSIELIRVALNKVKKTELIELLVMFSEEHAEIRRDLEIRLSIAKPVKLVVKDVRESIALATVVDDRRINYNFDYDHASYEVAQTGLERLVECGELEEVKRLAIELMKKGSYQVACSDEGLMTEEIENCLQPVIKAVGRVGGEKAKLWAKAMISADEVGFICDTELRSLAEAK